MNNIEEITLILTRKCNLKCSFCNVIYNNKYNAELNCDIVMSKYAPIHSIITNTTKSHINLVLMGGELFSNDVNDDVIQSYKILLAKTDLLCTQCHKTLSVSLMSNLITKRIDRIVDVAKSVKHCDVHGSFDFEQRFTNPKLLEMFLDNIQWYDQQGIDLCFGFILMTTNINSFYNNHKLIPIFDWLYSRYPIYYDYYHSTNRSAEIVDERTIGQFLIWLDNHYPNIETLQNLRNKKHKTCCPATFIIDGVATRCCNFPLVAKQYAIKKQCFSCQYKNVCSHPCIRIMSNSSDCFVKMYYEYLDAKNDIN